MTNTFTDDLLGLITIRIHTRARRIIMRPIANGVIVTVPPHTLQSEVKNSLLHFRQRLHAGQLKIKICRIKFHIKSKYWTRFLSKDRPN